MSAARFPRGILKWRWIVLVLMALAAWHTWDAQWVPREMSPCWGQYLHDPYKEALDWQMSHPIEAGIYSGISLGFWPGGYAIPRGCTYVNEGAGIPPWTYTPFAHLAFPAFHIAATVFSAFFAWLYLAFLRWAFRPAPGYTWEMPFKSQRQSLSPSISQDTPRNPGSGNPGDTRIPNQGSST